MTREIKFRAWDKSNKIMHYDVEFIRSGTDGNDWIIFKSDKQKLEDGKVLDNPYFSQQIELIQYTGLKDMNGVEVYEGDIIIYSKDKIYNIPKYKVVKYGGGRFFVELYNKYNNQFCIGSPSYMKNHEVIGNIYENPELLNQCFY